MSLLALERAVVAWTRRLALFAGWLLLAIAIVTTVDACLRYFFGRPIQGTFEATELLLATAIFFAMPYTSLTDGHVSVDILTSRLPVRGQYVVIALNALATAVLLGLITVQMASLAREFLATSRTTITARIPVFPFILPVTVTAALATLCFLLQAVGAVGRAVRPGLPPLPTGGR